MDFGLPGQERAHGARLDRVLQMRGRFRASIARSRSFARVEWPPDPPARRRQTETAGAADSGI